MSLEICKNCGKGIDTDYDAEHFEECKAPMTTLYTCQHCEATVNYKLVNERNGEYGDSRERFIICPGCDGRIYKVRGPKEHEKPP